MDKTITVPDFEIRRALFSEIYQHFSAPKAQRKAFSIMEAAIACVARKGYDGVTLEMIARGAGVTRPLIRYYFENLDVLLETSTRYIRLLFQEMAIAALLDGTRPLRRLVLRLGGSLPRPRPRVVQIPNRSISIQENSRAQFRGRSSR